MEIKKLGNWLNWRELVQPIFFIEIENITDFFEVTLSSPKATCNVTRAAREALLAALMT